ncbi:MAG: hypothetical protein ABI921_12340 [Panacibacter sp.]
MITKCILFLLLILSFSSGNSIAQAKKIDTTLKINEIGYRVICNNKNADNNTVNVSPVGFKNTARDITFTIKGKLTKPEIGDLNNDGFPDLMIYVFGIPNSETGTAICISSSENKSLAPIYFPDIYDNPKLREGYKGHDEFSIRYGLLSRSFPVYKSGNTDSLPTGGKRVVQYQVVTKEGRSAFEVLRTYDAN